MLRRIDFSGILIPLAAAVALSAASLARAQEAPDAKAVWQVNKSSGEVWLTTSGVQPASLTEQGALKPGDSIRTGRNGRVLLVRGQESILVAPNSAITIPPPKDPQSDAQSDGQSTTILQRAGQILLQVEKRNVRNFEVETPYLVAAVKGTEFRVSLNRVDVLKGSVEVADLKSGQHALVFPGQSAKVGPQGGGLSLSGAGALARPGPTERQPWRWRGVARRSIAPVSSRSPARRGRARWWWTPAPAPGGRRSSWRRRWGPRAGWPFLWRSALPCSWQAPLSNETISTAWPHADCSEADGRRSTRPPTPRTASKPPESSKTQPSPRYC